MFTSKFVKIMLAYKVDMWARWDQKMLWFQMLYLRLSFVAIALTFCLSYDRFVKILITPWEFQSQSVLTIVCLRINIGGNNHNSAQKRYQKWPFGFWRCKISCLMNDSTICIRNCSKWESQTLISFSTCLSSVCVFHGKLNDYTRKHLSILFLGSFW